MKVVVGLVAVNLVVLLALKSEAFSFGRRQGGQGLFSSYLQSSKRDTNNKASDVPLRPLRSYDSYEKFNPDQYEKGSPEFNLAMINYLLDMKMHGQDIKELDKTKEFGVPEMIGHGEDNIICKMEPYNLCYTVDEQGNMHPLGDHRPVRLLRIYK